MGVGQRFQSLLWKWNGWGSVGPSLGVINTKKSDISYRLQGLR